LYAAQQVYWAIIQDPVSFLDVTHAVAEATVFTVSATALTSASQHEWTLEKRDGRWLIVEMTYK